MILPLKKLFFNFELQFIMVANDKLDIMKRILSIPALCLMALCATGCGSDNNDEPIKGGDENPAVTPGSPVSVSRDNVTRAIEIIDAAVDNYFTGAGMAMSRYYNPYTDNASSELGSVWMYTSSIEAVNSALKGMSALKASGEAALYDANCARYKELLANLIDNLEFYAGTYTLTSYTGTNTWTVYGVDRGAGKGAAAVEGIHNVYDDQMWLVRELIEAYEATGVKAYLDKAEYLTSYILDGWDSTLDENGNEHGGITWGPGYVTKHSCSNGPIVAPLVKLATLYKGKGDEVIFGVVNADKTRGKKTEKKCDYYLDMAKKVYAYQTEHLLNPSTGLFDDMMGGDDNGGNIRYENVGDDTFRAYVALRDRTGKTYSYNTGSMISGAAALYGATSEESYLTDMRNLCDRSFSYFAAPASGKEGCYTFDITGFNNWFNNVLERSYVDAAALYQQAGIYAEAFQCNLDYAYSKFLYNHMLPASLLVGWNQERGKNNIEAMFTFAFAAEYASLAEYQLNKKL